MIGLMPYQITGAKFLSERTAAILADDMGLGKSAQAVFACDLVGAKNILVVCPASVKEVWRTQFEQWSFAPRKIRTLDKKVSDDTVTIVSYEGSVRRLTTLARPNWWDVVICDEAHYLKTVGTARTKAMYGEKKKKGLAHLAKRVWLLTGTPTPNDQSEMFPHCATLFSDSFLDYGGKPLTFWKFRQRYCTLQETPFGIKVTGAKNTAELKRKLAPHVLRRTKAEVMPEMPPIRYAALPLTAELKKVDVSKDIQAKIDAALASADPMAELARISSQNPGMRRVMGIAKVSPLAVWVGDQLEAGLEKIAVYAYHTDVIKELAALLQRFNPVVLHGETTPEKRTMAVSDFQTKPDVRVFIGQLTAAGTGITLTAAHTLVFAECSWTPGENDQVANRVHRIGQGEPVTVYHASVAGSVDERIAAVCMRKSRDIEELFA